MVDGPGPTGGGGARPGSDDTVDPDGVWEELLTLADARGDAHDGDDLEERTSRLVAVLQRDGGPRVLDLALPVLADPATGRRHLAARVLAQLGYDDGSPFEGVIAAALAAAARTADDDDREVFVWGLTAAGGARWTAEACRYADDPYPPVRLALARNLVLMEDPPGDRCVATLIGLSADADAEVRDAAVFSLATLNDRDSPAIRAALAARLNDDAGDIRHEATVGLARRGDGRVLRPLLDRLGGDPDDVFRLDLEAAAELAHPALMPVLVRLCEHWADDGDRMFLDLALTARRRCDPRTRARATSLEAELVAALNARWAGAGWSVVASDSYPRTVLRLRGGDVGDGRPHRVWDDVTVADFRVEEQVERFLYDHPALDPPC
ncbi:HEAT repeat domain-containing protein [Nakamurella deserti]|uniref:HEAT repeat domain-containing protein n=1 Tax=Nakamurella deserti TaxID=2164074 RepID=UPI000DBE4186|nr:HEAT repeat domain-containing protein [Nakamurella deserti]